MGVGRAQMLYCNAGYRPEVSSMWGFSANCHHPNQHRSLRTVCGFAFWCRFHPVPIQPSDHEDAEQHPSDLHRLCPPVHEPSNHSPTEQDLGARACTTAFSTIWDSVWQWWLNYAVWGFFVVFFLICGSKKKKSIFDLCPQRLSKRARATQWRIAGESMKCLLHRLCVGGLWSEGWLTKDKYVKSF